LIEQYIFILGIIQLIIGISETIFPNQTFSLWSKWIKNRLFPFHGLLMIGAGFPLTMYNSILSGIIFPFGLVVTLTGPFILIYPEKIRTSFDIMNEKISSNQKRRILLTDAFLRIASGIIFITAFFLN